jgi:hypothetical protein
MIYIKDTCFIYVRGDVKIDGVVKSPTMLLAVGIGIGVEKGSDQHPMPTPRPIRRGWYGTF